MRFMVTGEWSRNRLLQTIVVLFSLYVAAFWVTNVLLYFAKMGLTYESVHLKTKDLKLIKLLIYLDMILILWEVLCH